MDSLEILWWGILRGLVHQFLFWLQLAKYIEHSMGYF